MKKLRLIVLFGAFITGLKAQVVVFKNTAELVQYGRPTGNTRYSAAGMILTNNRANFYLWDSACTTSDSAHIAPAGGSVGCWVLGTNPYLTASQGLMRVADSFILDTGYVAARWATIASVPVNNSQLSNGSGYITSSALSPYLSLTTAASTYQPIGSYATAAKVAADSVALSNAINIKPTIYNNPTRSLNTAFTISSTGEAWFCYSIQIAVTVTVTLNATQGTVTPQYSVNGGTSWVNLPTISYIPSLVGVGLLTSQVLQVNGFVPKGALVKLVTSGTGATFTILNTQERY